MTPGIDLLASRGVEHQVLSYDHDPAAESYGLEAVEALGLVPEEVFKTLVTSFEADNQIRLAVAVLPVINQLSLKAMARALGVKRATMADVADAERSTGYLVGGISPLGQKKLLPTVIDESALTLEVMHISAGRRGLEVAVSPEALIGLLDATTAPLAT